MRSFDMTQTGYMSFAINAHADQKYGDLPYEIHLSCVANILDAFGFSDYKFQASGWLHDVIEDTVVTLEAVRTHFGSDVANMVWACTGEGKNRKERVTSILEKLALNADACIVKVADRIANVKAGGKVQMYFDEHEDFRETVKNHVPKNMVGYLDKLLNWSAQS